MSGEQNRPLLITIGNGTPCTRPLRFVWPAKLYIPSTNNLCLCSGNEMSFICFIIVRSTYSSKIAEICSMDVLKAQYTQRQNGTKSISVLIVLGLCNLDGQPNLRFRVKIA